MFYFIFFLGLFFVIQGYVILDEETLIILASFVWVDAAGGALRKSLENLLVDKGTFIYKTFLFFLKLKKDIVATLLSAYSSRSRIAKDFILAYSISLKNIFKNVLFFYASALKESKKIGLVIARMAKNISNVYQTRISSNIFNLLNRAKNDVSKSVLQQGLVFRVNYGELDSTKLRGFIF